MIGCHRFFYYPTVVYTQRKGESRFMTFMTLSHYNVFISLSHAYTMCADWRMNTRREIGGVRGTSITSNALGDEDTSSSLNTRVRTNGSSNIEHRERHPENRIARVIACIRVAYIHALRALGTRVLGCCILAMHTTHKASGFVSQSGIVLPRVF